MTNPTKERVLAHLAVRIVAVAIFVLALGCQGTEGEVPPASSSDASGESTQQAEAKPENLAYNFSLTNLKGETVHLSDFKGRVVMVDFWGTWCGPCRRSIPDLIELYKTHNPAGFDVVGIALERRKLEEGLIPYMAKSGIPYPVLIGSREVVAGYGGIKSVPTAFLIGRDGTIRQRFVGVTPRNTLEKAILELLAEPPPA